jgi:hypothetical protein
MSEIATVVTPAGIRAGPVGWSRVVIAGFLPLSGSMGVLLLAGIGGSLSRRPRLGRA